MPSVLSETFKTEAFKGGLSGLDEASGFGYGASLEGTPDIFESAMESVWDFVSRQSDPFTDQANTVQQAPQSLAEFAETATPEQQQAVQAIEETLGQVEVKQVTEINHSEVARGAPQMREDVQANVAQTETAMTSAMAQAEAADKAATKQEQAGPAAGGGGGKFLLNTGIDAIAVGVLGPAGYALTSGSRVIGQLLQGSGSMVTHNQTASATPVYERVRKGEENGYRPSSGSSSHSYDAVARQASQGPAPTTSPVDAGRVQLASESLDGVKQLLVKDPTFLSLQRDNEFYKNMDDGFKQRADKGIAGTIDNLAGAVELGAGDVAHDALKKNNMTPTLNGSVV